MTAIILTVLIAEVICLAVAIGGAILVKY